MRNKVDDAVNLFSVKCAKLDIPPECCPEQNYLQKILRQRLSLFESFIHKADARNDVDRIRKNILIQLKLSENKLSRSSKSVPKEYSNYVKYTMLLDKIRTLEAQNKNLKQQETQRLRTIQHNDQRHAKAKECLRTNKSRLDVLQAKSFHLNEEIAAEQALDKKIIAVTPRKFSSNERMENHIKLISESIQILRKFSLDSAGGDAVNCLYMNKESFWKDIAEKISNVPNVVLFQFILQQLGSSTIDSIIATSISPSQRDAKAQKVSDKLLPSLYEHKIVCGIELLSLRKMLAGFKSTCAESIQVVENQMDALLNASMDYSFQLEDDDIIGDFVTALIAKLNCEGKIQFCSDAIASLKQQIDNNANVREYERVLNDTKEIYSLIDEKIVSVQEHVAQVHQINEKINFSKISVMRMIQSLKMEKSQQHNRTLMNQTLNSTIMAAPNKLSEVNLPMHESELQTFLDVAMHNFDKRVNMNRLFLMNNDTLPAKHFLYPHEYLISMEKCLNLAASLRPLSLDLESSVSGLTDIDCDALEKQHDENCEEISLMLDSATKFNVLTNSHLRNMSALYEYGMKNPLRKFIPQSRKFLEKTYGEYEKDYMLYYNMIRN